MKIFVTGGTGFIGKHLVRKLKEDKNNNLLLLSQVSKEKLPWLDISENIKVVVGNLSNIKEWKKEVESFKPETVIHLAWEGIPDYGSQMSIRNLKYGLDLFDFLAAIKCKTILSAGSCWEYGQQSGKLNEDTPLKLFNAFSATKNSLHLLGREIAKENNMKFIWTRLFYVYGPGQRETSLIPYLINCVQDKKTPEIKNPLAKNDFVYVEDVAEAFSMLMENCKESGVYNIGSGYLTSVQEIIKIIFDNYRLRYQPKDENKEPDSTDVLSNFYADISRIKRDVDWQPRTGIEKGIEKTINYCQNL